MTIGRKISGFTLIELMVSIAVLAVIVTLAVPSFQSTINGNRLTSAVNESAALVQTARNEAIRRNQIVTVCATADPDTATSASTCSSLGAKGLVAFFKGGDVITRATLPANVTMYPSSAFAGKVSFRPDGFARAGSGLLKAALSFCIPTKSPQENVRLLGIVSGSRVTTARKDGNGLCATPADTI